MADLISFCVSVLKQVVNTYMSLEIGGYSFGLFMVATTVVSVLIGTLVISFRASGGSPGSAVRPPRRR